MSPWRSVRTSLLCSVALVAGGLAGILPAGAEKQSEHIRNTYGEIGMLDMPSGHMADDGELAFSMGDVGSTQRYNLSFQALPWAEASFRYSRPFGYLSDRNFYDRSFGLKIRLLRENAIVPDVSVGIRDLLGTGVYSSEYVAASKHIGNFDLTAGMGWGRLSDTDTLSNPFGYVLSSFKTRDRGVADTGGQFNWKQFFHGPKVGVFGGAVWHTPIDNLSLMGEYSSDKYTGEALWGGVKVRSPFNVGLNYQFRALSLSGGWFYGTTYGFTVSIHGDSTETVSSAMRIGPAVPPALVRDNTEQHSALQLMMQRNDHVSVAKAGGPWVHVPTEAEQTKLVLQQALLSEGRGVRNVDIQQTTLVIDAHGQRNAQAQCARYAEIVSAAGTPITSIAMTDLQSAAGNVVFCPVAGHAKYAQADSQDKAASDRITANAVDQATLESKLRADMKSQSLELAALSLGTSELWVYYYNGSYRLESEAVGRLVRLLMAAAPPSVEVFHLIAINIGVPVQEVTIARGAMERATLGGVKSATLGDAIALSAPSLDNPALDRAAEHIYPHFYWSLDPKLTEHLFDPDSPLEFMVYADAIAGVQLTRGLTLFVEGTANIWNNYSFNRAAGSQLPHVRTDLLQYVKQGQNGIAALEVDYRTRLARDVFIDVRAGYLEDMYMGVGGQILWRPENSRLSFGMDIYQVWKRDFNRLFGVQEYNVLTGHASVYYRSPWYGLNLNVHVGRYLAGDHGATFEVTRRFSTGVEVGAFATFTNVPAWKFGEGSFDKGIIVRIPFEWSLPIHSQSSYNLHLNSLTRDGGQRLNTDNSLYRELDRTSYGEIVQHLDDIVEP
ncbi:MAG TPA: YjbH domain-containing protein [Rhizomicrobium sp.]